MLILEFSIARTCEIDNGETVSLECCHLVGLVAVKNEALAFDIVLDAILGVQIFNRYHCTTLRSQVIRPVLEFAAREITKSTDDRRPSIALVAVTGPRVVAI